jgi:hypothetical protein
MKTLADMFFFNHVYLFLWTVKTGGVPDILLLKKTGVQTDPKGKGNYTGVLKISTEDLRENLKTQSSPPSSSSSSKRYAGAGLQQRRRGTCHLETKHRGNRRRGRAAAERQPYCRWVRRDDGEKPPIITGEKLLHRDRRCWRPKPALPAATLDAWRQERCQPRWVTAPTLQKRKRNC